MRLEKRFTFMKQRLIQKRKIQRTTIKKKKKKTLENLKLVSEMRLRVSKGIT